MLAGDAAPALLEVEAQCPTGPDAGVHTVMAYQLEPAQLDAIEAALAEVARGGRSRESRWSPCAEGYQHVQTGLLSPPRG